MNTIVVEVTDDIIEMAIDYAKKVISTVNYADSKQYDNNKILFDHAVGKIGEECVKRLFEKNGISVEGPDYNIYYGRKKSWDSDLYIDNIGIAVKTQNTKRSEKVGVSWTFQRGPARRDPILDKEDAIVVFVLFDHENKICRVYEPRQIKELEFWEPVVPKYRGYKAVVYEKYLKKLEEKEKQNGNKRSSN